MRARPLNTPIINRPLTRETDKLVKLQSRLTPTKRASARAIVYCEGNFGALDGKTANGLVRYSENYEILSVIDSEKAGLDSGMVLDDKTNDIPICRNLADALKHAGDVPDYFIFGMAPSTPLKEMLLWTAILSLVQIELLFCLSQNSLRLSLY